MPPSYGTFIVLLLGMICAEQILISCLIMNHHVPACNVEVASQINYGSAQ